MPNTKYYRTRIAQHLPNSKKHPLQDSKVCRIVRSSAEISLEFNEHLRESFSRGRNGIVKLRFRGRRGCGCVYVNPVACLATRMQPDTYGTIRSRDGVEWDTQGNVNYGDALTFPMRIPLTTF